MIFSGWTLGISTSVALSAVALIGYLFGRSQRTRPSGDGPADREGVQRAMRIARQLEAIADDLRQDLALHKSQVDQFKAQLRRAEGDPSDEVWRRLQEEAEGMVGPTLDLVSQLSTAYDKIRQQSQSLANFTGGRTDPLTGLANSRSLEENLDVLLRARASGGGEFSVVVVSIDGDAVDRAVRDTRVQTIGQELARGLRGDDFAARYGVNDFVVVLPATALSGACVFGARLRKTAAEKLGLSISCGLAESMPADTPKSLLGRADSAAYSARAAGPGQQFLHTGAAIRPDTAGAADESPEPATPAEKSTARETAAADEDASDEEATVVVSPALAGPVVMGDLTPSPVD